MQLSKASQLTQKAPAQRLVRRGSCVQAMASAKPALKLFYFDIPGRAEATRLMLRLGKYPFEDYLLKREEWAELKPKMPFGQVPVLEVDGKMLSQSSAMERYVAKLTDQYPSDPWEAAKVDETAAFMGEWLDIFIPSFFIKDENEKIAARKQVVEEKLKPKIEKLSALIEQAGPSNFLCGPKITYADVQVFVQLSFMVSGFFQGVPSDLYASYPAVRAFHARIASLPEVAEAYKDVTEGPRATYKALP
uniref:Glutathione S-transferase n=1 Tax=Dunaliella tertiolecta TaxID=3047 RepID=A0A7S3VSV3_DUNTE